MFLVVPNSVRDAIYKKIDEELEKVPGAKQDREAFYGELLAAYDVTGEIPDFKIAPKPVSEE